MLVLTLLFAAAAALFFTGRPRSEGYTVTTQRDDAGPQEPQSGPLNINTATAAQLDWTASARCWLSASWTTAMPTAPLPP